MASEKMTDLLPQIEMNGTCCLNTQSTTVTNILKRDSSAHLDSYTDEQLLFYIPFMNPVKIHSLKITAPANGPKNIHLFVNKNDIGFEDVKSIEPVQSFELKDKDIKPDSLIALKFVRFQNVSSLTIFIENNQNDSEKTTINHLAFFGTPLQAQMKISELVKKQQTQS